MVNGKACGCCQGPEELPAHDNRPGLPSISYRLGTHGKFLKKMLQSLHSQKIPDGDFKGTYPLQALTTREEDDPSIALLDAWATIADVITFYQERIANEGYLRTATERRSVLELAREIGYELSPGVASSTYLAFTADPPMTQTGGPTGAPEVISVPGGIKVQSLPAQGKLPQTFETMDDLAVRAEWNVLYPLALEDQKVTDGTSSLYIKGTATRLQPGDPLLITSGDDRSQWRFQFIRDVRPYQDQDRTQVFLESPLKQNLPAGKAVSHPGIFALRQKAAFFGYNAPDWKAMTDSVKIAYKPDYNPSNPETAGYDWPDINMGSRSAIYLDTDYSNILPDTWAVLVAPQLIFPIITAPPVLLARRRFPGSTIGLRRVVNTELGKIQDISTDSCTDFTLNSKTTRLALDVTINENVTGFTEPFGRRETVVYIQSDELELAPRPLITPIFGKEITLDRSITDLDIGRDLIFSGNVVSRVEVQEDIDEGDLTFISDDRRISRSLAVGEVLSLRSLEVSDSMLKWHVVASDGVTGSVTTIADTQRLAPDGASQVKTASEVAVVDDLPEDGGLSRIALKEPLDNIYDRSTLKIYGNVVSATHGETVREVLGSGNGSIPNQSFTLKKPPLTYIQAPTVSGSMSTLLVTVNDSPWTEVPSLFNQGQKCQCYTVRMNDEGSTTITSGDGTSASRLPTGRENIRAVYRSGIGPDGEVDAGKIILIQTRPLGIREVTNPVPATGSAPPEKLEDARVNAPRTALILDRAVSLKDYEDFARGFAGVGKALAEEIHLEEDVVIHLTVGSSLGGALSKDSTDNLLRALDSSRDTTRPVIVSSFIERTFSLKARVLADPGKISSDVLASVRQALLDAFSFGSRSFGQPVTAAEVITVIQSVDGVIAVNLEQLTEDDIRLSAATRVNAVSTVLLQPAARFDAGIEAVHGIIPRISPRLIAPLIKPRPQLLKAIPATGSAGLKEILFAATASIDGGTVIPAELLVINPQGITLEAVA